MEAGAASERAGDWWNHTEVVMVSRAEFDRMGEYSCSLPTGVEIGKRWKCDRSAYVRDATAPDWWQGEYVKHDDPTKALIVWRQICVVEVADVERELGELREMVLEYSPGRVGDPVGARWDELRGNFDRKLARVRAMVASFAGGFAAVATQVAELNAALEAELERRA